MKRIWYFTTMKNMDKIQKNKRVFEYFIHVFSFIVEGVIMGEVYKESIERLRKEIKSSFRRLRKMATGSGIIRRQDLKKWKVFIMRQITRLRIEKSMRYLCCLPVHKGTAAMCSRLQPSRNSIIEKESAIVNCFDFVRIIYCFTAVAALLLLRSVYGDIRDDKQKSNSKDVVNPRIPAKPLKMPAVWLMIRIIFATLTLSTGYYYISPYAKEVFGVSALLGVVLSLSSQYIRPIASFGAGVPGDRINNSKVMLIGWRQAVSFSG